MERKSYKKGQIIFNAGDPGSEMFEVRKGTVGVYSNYGKPAEKLLSRVGLEETFGEMSVLEDAPRSAAAVALEDVELRVITKDDLRAFFEEKPYKVLAVMSRMSRNLRDLTGRYLDACKILAEVEDAGTDGPGAETQRQLREIARSVEEGSEP